MKRFLAVVVAGALATVATPALAQKKGKKDPAQEEKEAKDKQARELYDQGITHYNLGEFDLAIEKFKAAYALTGAPGLLFNIAQAYRLKKDYEQALYFYKTYLRLAPDAPNRGDVEARIAEMEKLMVEQNKLDKAQPVGTIPPGGTGVPQGDGGQKPPPGDGGQKPPPDDGGQKPPPDDGGQQVAGGGGGGDGGSSVVGGGGDTGLSTVWTPRKGTLGFNARADVDTATFKGAAFAIGLSYAVTPMLEVSGGALVSGDPGASVGVCMLFSAKKLRPLASLSIPMFFGDGTNIGVHVAGGLRFDLSKNLGLQLDLGVAHFFSAPDGFTTTYFVPSLGVQGRL